MAKSTNEVILSNFILNETFTRKILPFFKAEYFTTITDKIIFTEIEQFVEKYNSVPTKEALAISINNQPDYGTDASRRAIEFIESVDVDYEKPNLDWLVETSEKFCKNAAVIIAITESLEIIDGKDQKQSRDAIPQILSKALAVSFDNNIGHDYFSNAENRYIQNTIDEERLEFDLEIFNKITRGGLPDKTLTLFLGGTGTGKTNVMCHLATSYSLAGKNVLYITLEMSEEKIGERIDANMLNINIGDLKKLGKEAFTSRLSKIASKSQGKLIIKEYPMHSASAATFKALVDELQIKANFVPDVILVDYLGICASSRYRGNHSVNTNTYYQSVAEELRGLAQYYKLPVISSIQTNRTGSTNSDLSLTDMADSFGIAMTGDLVIGLVSNDELAELNQMLFIVLKNRHNDLNYYKKFLQGIDRGKMRVYDLEEGINEKETIAPVIEQEPSFFDKKSDNKHDFSQFKI